MDPDEIRGLIAVARRLIRADFDDLDPMDQAIKRRLVDALLRDTPVRTGPETP